jgi:hypothetical protein
MKMKRLILFVATLLGILMLAAPTQAGPMMIWQAPWGVTFDNQGNALLATAETSAFGIDATLPGQMTNLGAAGDMGIAGAVVSADAQTALVGFNATGAKDAIADVKFWRPFDLPGVDPATGLKVNAWRVDVGGSLKGLLDSDLSSGTATVQVKGVLAYGNTGFNLIANKVPGSALVFDNNQFNLFGIEGDLSKTLNSSTESTVTVPPGTYTFIGELNARATYNQGSGFGGTQSEFSILQEKSIFEGKPPSPRDTSQGYQVTVDAIPFFGGGGGGGPQPQPNPEPSTLTLLGLGSIGLVGCGRRRRKA